MVTQKVYFINNKLRGNSHEIIDVSLIVILANLFDLVDINLSKSRSKILFDICSKYLTKKGRIGLEEKLRWRYSKLDIKSLFWMDFFVAIKDAFLMLFGEKNALYVYSYGNSRFSIHLVNLISRITNKRVVICAHNELDVLLKENYSIKSNWHYLINRFYRNTNWSRNLKILVLGDFIIDKLRNVLPKERVDHFISIDHPYFRTDNKSQFENFSKNTDGIINIGLAGSVEPGSSMDNLIEFSSLIEDSKINLNIITRLYEDNPKLRSNKNVKYLNPNNTRLSRDQYDMMISKMDYLYYPHSIDRFQFSASGSIFEAVAKGKIAIAYANPNFTYLFNKYGSFGYLINSSEELKEVLSNLTCDKSEEMLNSGKKMLDLLDPLNIELKFDFSN